MHYGMLKHGGNGISHYYITSNNMFLLFVNFIYLQRHDKLLDTTIVLYHLQKRGGGWGGREGKNALYYL